MKCLTKLSIFLEGDYPSVLDDLAKDVLKNMPRLESLKIRKVMNSISRSDSIMKYSTSKEELVVANFIDFFKSDRNLPKLTTLHIDYPILKEEHVVEMLKDRKLRTICGKITVKQDMAK